MYRERCRNKIIIMILVGIICLMGAGYAAFNTRLNITGTSEISSSWNIKIIGANVSDTGGKGENVKNTYTDLTATLEANLYDKGDYVEYSIIVENDGDFDAKLETLGITNSNNEAVKITSTGFTKGETLFKGTTKTLKVKIEYNASYNGDASGTSGESSVSLDFVQNSGGTIEPTKDHLVTYDYTTNGGESTTAENEYVAEGADINLSYTAAKDGYDFVGWNTNPQAADGLQSLTMGTSDVTLYAIFKVIDTTPPVISNVSTTSTTNSITAVVTASDDESEITKYEFKIGDGEWIDNGTDNAYTFTGLTQGTGYDISVRVTNEKDLSTEKSLNPETINLTDKVTTTGAGLYADSYEEGRYVYKGANPNNYVNFNNELWRIVSIESDNSLKIMRNETIGTMAYDEINTRPTATNTYCQESSTNGCNVWSKIDGTFSNATGTYTGTVVKDSSINTYLNNDYYNSLSNEAKKLIKSGTFNIGVIDPTLTNLSNVIKHEKTYNWNGKIGLINASDFVRSTTNAACTSTSVAYNTTSCNGNNYLSKGIAYKTINGRVANTRAVINVTAAGKLNNGGANATNNVFPVTFLNNNVKIISGEGTSTNPYQLGSGISTTTLNKPTFSEIGTDNGKTVTITYPSGSGLTYEYKKDSGEWTTATQSQQVEFNESGTLVARVSDGTNAESSTYTVEIYSKGAEGIIDNAGTVTSGDGLYKDSYESNVYTYRGSNPNNYVTFNGEQWRIISVNTSDNTIKIMRNAVLSDGSYDTTNGRYQGSSGYCNLSGNGCNIWGSSSSLYDINMSPITTLATTNNGTSKLALPSAEAELNTYLNTTYYNNTLNVTARSMVETDAVYKAGVLYHANTMAALDMNQVNAVKWKGKVALIDATEYVRASTYSSCTNVSVARNIDKVCKNNNWMFNSDIWWTMSPFSDSVSPSVWYVSASGNLSNQFASYAYGVRPVLTLSPDIQITGGDGSKSKPYTISL